MGISTAMPDPPGGIKGNGNKEQKNEQQNMKAPRLRYESLDFDISARNWLDEIQNQKNIVREKFGDAPPIDISLFALSYFHDSIITKIIASNNGIEINLILAATSPDKKSVFGRILFQATRYSLENMRDEFNVMDTRVGWSANGEPILMLWIGNSSHVSIEYNKVEFEFSSEGKLVSVDDLKSEESYGPWIFL